MMQLPTLYKKTTTGAIQEWTITVLPVAQPSGPAAILTNYGQVGGKHQTATDVVYEGKNIGRANATDALEQAQAEAKSKWEKQLKKGYVQSLEDAEAGKTDEIIQGGISPMLAHQYDKQGHKISYPAFVQPKLDGHRCIAIIQDGKATLWSRTRKPITGVPHIIRQLEFAFSNQSDTVVLDGELYNHTYRDNFEELTSFIRSAKPKPGHEVVQYWIYDQISDDPQSVRILQLNEVNDIIQNSNHIGRVFALVFLPTEEVSDEEEMVAVFGAYMEQGFEGLMVRNRNASYKNSRSYDLQKVKIMQDAEFEVINVLEGRGKMAGLAIFECKTDEGKTFTVKMEGSLDSLRKYVEDPSLAIGRLLTVRFQNLTAEGLPRFPVGVRFREDV